MGMRTPLFEAHKALGARIVPFGGWDMPLHYGSQLDEHHQVRRDAGMFDVSHMTVVDLRGAGTQSFLRRLLANDVAKLKEAGKALYSCMLNEHGGVIDDLITYYLGDNYYRLVINAATTEKDLIWIGQQAMSYDVTVERRSDLAIIAVQGPQAREKTLPLLPGDLTERVSALNPFFACADGDWLVARTGYTGEDGVEIMLPQDVAAPFWLRLHEADVAPCGLGARDTLRLEAGMNLYGSDMDEQTTPLESGLAWTVSWEPKERRFIGRGALEHQSKTGSFPTLVGLLLLGKGILRNHQKIFLGDAELGEITSGGFSPSLQRSIALARINGEQTEGLEVDIRGQRQPLQVVDPPFVRNGKACIDL